MMVVCPKCGVYHDGRRDGDPCLRCMDLCDYFKRSKPKRRKRPHPKEDGR